MHIGDMLIEGQRVANQYGVGAIGVQFAIGLIGDLERREIDAAIELQRLVHAELRHRRGRMIGLMGAILAVNRRTGYRMHVCHFGTDLLAEALQTESGHKKTRPERKVRPGSTLSPACLASCLTWLQAGRLK